MPKPRPLSSAEAQRSLVNRLAGRVDGLRQFNTKFGTRPYRCFLVWTAWTGAERGEGDEVEVARQELLPTPRVLDLTSVGYSGVTAGVLPMGSVRLDELSATLKLDQLNGRTLPVAQEKRLPEPYDFYYELMDDGRSGAPPTRQKYRVAAQPFLDAENVQWRVMLERISEDARSDGTSSAGDDA